MARINFPSSFLKQTVLFKKVKAKHDADAAASVLIPYITEQSIDFTDDDNDTTDALAADAKFQQFEKNAEELTEKRDKLIDSVFEDHRKCVQYLKKLYRNNVQKLGDWSVTVNNRNRIVYPTDFLNLQIAIGLFIDKHNSYAAGTSPLQPFLDENDIDLTQNDSDNDDALTANSDFLSANATKEETNEHRDNLFDPIAGHLHGIGEFLVGLYPTAPHKAGQWGFVIDASPQADVTRTYTLPSGDIKTVKNIKLSSDIVNVGSVTIYIKPHNRPSATPIAINPNAKFKVVWGYGSIDVDNSAGAADASIKAIITK